MSIICVKHVMLTKAKEIQQWKQKVVCLYMTIIFFIKRCNTKQIMGVVLECIVHIN